MVVVAGVFLCFRGLLAFTLLLILVRAGSAVVLVVVEVAADEAVVCHAGKEVGVIA